MMSIYWRKSFPGSGAMRVEPQSRSQRVVRERLETGAGCCTARPGRGLSDAVVRLSRAAASDSGIRINPVSAAGEWF